MQCYYSTTAAAAACLLAYCTLLSCQWIQWSAFSAVLLTHNMRQIDLYANCTPYLTPLHMLNAFSFLPTHTKYSTLYKLLWLAKKAITKNIRLEKHTKDTQTQTFYILCFTIQSFQLNSHWFFLSFFLISFQLWVLHFRSNCFMVSTRSQTIQFDVLLYWKTNRST